jgi:DNA-binding NarL/FixJ family response regulator
MNGQNAYLSKQVGHGVMNVFIVEDQAWFLEQLKALVAGVRDAQVVGSADTAQSAIASISTSNPNVVLVDLKLREGTGFEVLRTIRARAPHIHLLVVTSFPTPGVKKACMIGGAHGFFDKLLELDQVRDTLENLSTVLN